MAEVPGERLTPLQGLSGLVLKRQNQRMQHTWLCSPFLFSWSWANCSSPEQEQGFPPPALLVAGPQLAMAGTGFQKWLHSADVASTPWTGKLEVPVAGLAQRWIHICLSSNWALVGQTTVLSAVRTLGQLVIPDCKWGN